MTYDITMGRRWRLALLAMAAAGCTTRSLADLRIADGDGGAASAPADALADSPVPELESDVGEDVADPALADGPMTAPEADAAGSLPDIPAAPPRLVFESMPGTRQYGGSSGNDTSGTCGADQVLIGYLGNASATGSPFVSRLVGRCGRVAVTAAPPYRVTVTDAGALDSVGPGTSNAFSAMCPADQVLVGFFGRDGILIDQVGFRCAPLLIEMGPPAVLVLGPITTIGPWPASKGGDDFAENCRGSGVANGHSITVASWISALGLRCTGLRLEP